MGPTFITRWKADKHGKICTGPGTIASTNLEDWIMIWGSRLDENNFCVVIEVNDDLCSSVDHVADRNVDCTDGVDEVSWK
jgi:hypothetical protein